MPISQTKRRFFSEATVSKKTEEDRTVKKKILCVIGLICYLVFVGGGIGLILSMQSGLDNVEDGIGANAALCVNAVSNMSDGDLSGVIVFAVLAVISVVALVTNIMSLSEDCYE